MDIRSLASILRAAALSPYPDERKSSEQKLNQLQVTPQHLLRLFQIVLDATCDMEVRQIASIQFKNFIAKNWSPKDSGDQLRILQSDKDFVRDNILVYVTQVPTLLRSQLGECLRTIIYADYPEKWPRLLDWVKYNLQNQQIYGALFVLRILSRKYKFKSNEERTPLSIIVEATFPLLLTIFNELVQKKNPSLEIAEFMNLIFEIFWSSIYLEHPRQLFDVTVFNDWMVMFLGVSEHPVPVEGQPMDPEIRKSWGWWKVKKWIVRIFSRLYSRFRDPQLQNPAIKSFSQMFQKNYAGRILEVHLNFLNSIRVGDYLPDRVTYLLLQYLRNCISKNIMYNFLLPHLDVLLFEIVFPLMCFNDNDQKFWVEDPHEYVRKSNNLIKDLYNPRTASMDFVNELVRKRGKENLPKFVQFVVGIIRSYDEAPPEHKPYRKKDGAMFAVGSLCDKLKQVDPYKSELERMLVQHIFHEFNSPVGHLRAKAAWVAGQYANINFSDQNNFLKALHYVVWGLRDPDFPVRVDSVFALRSLIRACKDFNDIRPILPQLLDDFFKLMNEVENADLSLTLETIVAKFGEEMVPYAFGLCQNLAVAYWRCLSMSEASDESDKMGALAAVSSLRAISTILQSFSSLSQLFVEIELTILPIMQKILTTGDEDAFKEVLEIASCMILYSPNISLDLWSLWPLMVDVLVNGGIDFFPNILVALDNFIYKGTAHFLTCKDPDYQQNLYEVLSNLMTDINIKDSEIESAPKLIEVVFQNCKGQVDQWVEPYLLLTMERFQRAETSHLQSLLIQVVANMLYYSPVLTFGVLLKTGLASKVFEIWFQMLQQKKKNGLPTNFQSEYEKKVCCLGLTSVLTLPSSQFSEEAFHLVFKATLDILVYYKDQLDEVAYKTEVDSEDDDDDVEWEMGMDENEDDDGEMEMDDTEDSDEIDSEDYDDDEAKFFCSDSDSRDDEDSDSDSTNFDDEDYEYYSPIDEVDAFVFFVDVITVVQASDTLRFQNLYRSLDSTYQAMAYRIAEHGELRRMEIEMENQNQKKAA